MGDNGPGEKRGVYLKWKVSYGEVGGEAWYGREKVEVLGNCN